jgi:DnaJ-class molecular chaperone
MWKAVAVLACLAVVALIVVASVLIWVATRTGRTVRLTKTAVSCIECGGKGWIAVPDRTLQFEGGVFVDNPTKNHICQTCGGTGTVLRG